MSNKTATATTTNSQQNKLDPRMDALLHGSDGDPGILKRAYELSMRPMNDNMRYGIDAGSAYLKSPQRAAMMNSLMGKGADLMSAPIAGNPFMNGGRMYQPSGSMGFGGGGMSGYAPPQFTPSQQGQTAQMPRPQQSTQQPQQQQPQQQQPQFTPEQLAWLEQMFNNRNGGS